MGLIRARLNVALDSRLVLPRGGAQMARASSSAESQLISIVR
jgi:hypothetical protein